MLPPSVDDAIRSIASDRTTGASKLARVSLETMMLLVVERQGKPGREELAAAARRISEAQPAMASVHNVAELFSRLLVEGADPREVQAHLRSELDHAHERIAGTFLKDAPDRASIMTLSHSEAVLACLRLLDEKGRLDRVYVMESRPLFEGRVLAETLAEGGIGVTILTDALGPSQMSRADLALIGADSVLRDGSVVNKVGSFSLALAAQTYQKPFYVACETLKFDARYTKATWPGSPPRDPSEVWESPREGVEIDNRYFEAVPAELVTRVVSERGGYAPDILRVMLSEGRQTAALGMTRNSGLEPSSTDP